MITSHSPVCHFILGSLFHVCATSPHVQHSCKSIVSIPNGISSKSDYVSIKQVSLSLTPIWHFIAGFSFLCLGNWAGLISPFFVKLLWWIKKLINNLQLSNLLYLLVSRFINTPCLQIHQSCLASLIPYYFIFASIYFKQITHFYVHYFFNTHHLEQTFISYQQIKLKKTARRYFSWEHWAVLKRT